MLFITPGLKECSLIVRRWLWLHLRPSCPTQQIAGSRAAEASAITFSVLEVSPVPPGHRTNFAPSYNQNLWIGHPFEGAAYLPS